MSRTILSLFLITVAAQAQGQRVSPQDQKAIPPFRIFDNLYYIGTNYVCSYILKTSAGLIMIDTLYDKYTENSLPEMRQIGLDPKDIKYVIITHGHVDHYGGAKAIQTFSDARVAMTEVDWALMEKSSRQGSGAIVHHGDRDIVIKDGDKLTLGDTTLKLYVTPGHTPGVASMEFPVYDSGKQYKAFLFGGHNVTSDKIEDFQMFIVTVRRLMATLSGVDVNLTSHPWAAGIVERGQLLAARKPGQPNPFVAPEEFKAFLQERLTDAETRLAAAH